MAAALAGSRPRRHAPRDYGAICPPDLVDGALDWQRRLTDAGFAGIHWPTEHGGRGLTPTTTAAWLLECARAGVPAVFNMVGFVLAGGAILRYGTPSSRAMHLRSTLTTDHVWCQLFSEPGRRQRPRLAVDTGRTRRRPLHRQRPEGVVLGRALQQLGHPDGTHTAARRRSTEARRHLVLPVSDGPAGHRGPPAEADDRRGRVRRGVLHRRRAAGRLPPRSAARRLGCRHGGADQRARPHRHLGDRARTSSRPDGPTRRGT
jgi:hypothetical protein